MLTIDGSYGEGGGQILRYAIALSIITNIPVEILNIRANRSPPGLKPQHYTVLSLLQKLSHADIEGLNIGSSTVQIHPHKVPGGSYDVAIGTAGSITLVFQACLLCGLATQESIKVTVSGGTDVQWSPSWDYFTHVFLPALEIMNINCTATLHQRGYYPKGGGKATITIHPIQNIRPVQFTGTTTEIKVHGIIHSANLPDHITKRMKHAVIKTFIKDGITPSITTENVTSPSPGVGITLWTRSEKQILGVSMLGKKGIPAEEIGSNAAETLLKDLHSGATIDEHLFDQILPYMALAQGSSSCCIRQLNNHAKTTLWLLNQFYQKDFSIINKKNMVHHVRILE